jgi:hypothetical protein
VHVCIINVAISRLGWTLMKDITSQHELSLTTHGRTPLTMYLEPYADIELSRKWPIICRYVLPDLGSTSEFTAHVQCRLSCPTASLLNNIASAMSRLYAFDMQSTFYCLRDPSDWRRDLGCFHGTPHTASPRPPPLVDSHVRGKPFPTCLSRQTCIAYCRPKHIKGLV